MKFLDIFLNYIYIECKFIHNIFIEDNLLHSKNIQFSQSMHEKNWTLCHIPFE